jgi:uncharacterized membrane protein
VGTPAGMSTEARKAVQHRDQADVEFARIVAFSDGVFAIAITLLVLALEVPANTDDLWQALHGLEDDFFAYAVSFAVVGKFWLSHHRFYSGLERFDNTLMGLNLLYLAWVVLIPFSSELLGEFGDDRAATVVYAANMAAVSATFMVQIIYAYGKGLMKAEAAPQERRFAGPANYVFVAIFLASIAIAFVSVPAAQLTWLAVFLVGHRMADWLDRRL